MHTELSENARSCESAGASEMGCESSGLHKDRDPVATCSDLEGFPADGCRMARRWQQVSVVDGWTEAVSRSAHLGARTEQES